MIVACVIIGMLAPLSFVLGGSQALQGKLLVIWEANRLGFGHKKRRPRTNQNDATVTGQEMVDHATVDATDGSTVGTKARGRWQIFVFRFLRSLIPRLLRTSDPENESVPVVPVFHSAEERDEAVARIGSIFDSETLNRPNELDSQDL